MDTAVSIRSLTIDSTSLPTYPTSVNLLASTLINGAFAKEARVEFGPLQKMITIYKLLNNPKSINDQELFINRKSISSTFQRKIRSSTFRDNVLKNHGTICACCNISIKELIEAAHIVPVEKDGSDNFSNGIPLCSTHHKAFDCLMFTYHPEEKHIVLQDGITINDLGITKNKTDLNISIDALKYRLSLFKE